MNADWEKKAFTQAKAIVAVSKQVERELVEIGVPPERIRVILNGVDLQEFSPGEAKRQTWGLPEGVTLHCLLETLKLLVKIWIQYYVP